MPVIARTRVQGSVLLCSQVTRAGRTARTLLFCCLYRASAPGQESADPCMHGKRV